MHIHIGHHLLGQIPSLLTQTRMRGAALLVSDTNTWKAAGAALYPLLAEHYQLSRAHLEAEVIPAREVAERLFPLAREADFLVAVGSGTMNDLTKYTAHACGKPYVVVATAASMNGYAAANASLWERHHKTSFPAAAPHAIYADLDVLAAAPAHLTASGMGDMLCRSTVEADSYLSHLALGTDFSAQAFAALREYEPRLGTLETLMEALIAAGQWMTRTGSSAVASQGEHMIAHTLEMHYGEKLRGMTHGQLVAVASVAMARRQFAMLEQEPVPHLLEPGGDLPSAKQFSPIHRTEINLTLKKIWPELADYIRRHCHPPEILVAMLKQAGAPTLPEEIGLTAEEFNRAMASAHRTRDRFTFLDLTPTHHSAV
jgi:glycerol-1-phosphate dehydrogenase [NAD(P)+]